EDHVVRPLQQLQHLLLVHQEIKPFDEQPHSQIHADQVNNDVHVRLDPLFAVVDVFHGGPFCFDARSAYYGFKATQYQMIEQELHDISYIATIQCWKASASECAFKLRHYRTNDNSSTGECSRADSVEAPPTARPGLSSIRWR